MNDIEERILGLKRKKAQLESLLKETEILLVTKRDIIEKISFITQKLQRITQICEMKDDELPSSKMEEPQK